MSLGPINLHVHTTLFNDQTSDSLGLNLGLGQDSWFLYGPTQ